MGRSGGDLFFEVMRTVAHAFTSYHRAELKGADRIPHGPALLVGNHGLFGLDTLVFFYLLYTATSQLPFGLADRHVFGFTPIQRLLRHVGGVVGTRENALELLRQGHHVVCYPGGSREVFKAPSQRYRLQWEQSLGFARVALESGVPIVPFAGVGVDDCYVNLGHPPLARSILGRYAVPVVVGAGALPLPVHLEFRIGEPLDARGIDDPAELRALTQTRVEELLHETSA